MTINTTRWNRVRYTLWAPLYDRVASFTRQRRRSIELLGLRPGERVLVDGAGTGADLAFIPPGVAVVAIDLTPAMVPRIRRRAASLGRPVDARVMDAEHLDFPDASFDAVILHLIVAVVPDPQAAVREAARVVRPGGRVAVFDKFVADGARPSLVRRALNPIANTLFTDLTRSLGPLLVGTGLRVVHREPALLGRFFEIAILRKEVEATPDEQGEPAILAEQVAVPPARPPAR